MQNQVNCPECDTQEGLRASGVSRFKSSVCIASCIHTLILRILTLFKL